MFTKRFLLDSISIVTNLEEMTDEEKWFFKNPCDESYEVLTRIDARTYTRRH